MRTAFEGALHGLPQHGVERARGCRAGKAPIAAGAGEDGELLLHPAGVAQDQDAAALDIEQRRDLRQHAFRQALDRFEIVERRGALDDHLEAAAGLDHAQELLIAPQRRRERGEELVGGQLGLCLVVIDVVVDDHAPLRRLAGLAGAQDDANRLVLELRADVIHQLEAGIVGLHHDVEENDGDVLGGAHELAAGFRRMGRDDLDALAVEAVIVKREAGPFVHGRVVVDDGDLPGRSGRSGGRRSAVLDHVHDVMLVGHSGSTSIMATSARSSFGAASGSLMRKTVPRPASDSSFSEPPRRRVTRL